MDDPSGLDDRDREVLRLLQAGLTDAAIARRLGASERTIGRCVRGLMDRVGASTRFQLGWQANARGWLDVQESGSGAGPLNVRR